MSRSSHLREIRDLSPTVDPNHHVQDMMQWHFSPETGCAFWLDRLDELDFDPLTDIKTHKDLNLFPDFSSDLRDVRVEDLAIRGLTDDTVFGVFESGATTGAPKRILLYRGWLDQLIAWSSRSLDGHGVPRDCGWINAVPSGPHMVGGVIAQQAAFRGGYSFAVDLDPRWVKRLITDGNSEAAGSYAEHIVDQIAHLLRTQNAAVLMITPPVLERLTRRPELVELVRENIRAINWVGTHMDADTRALYKDEIFPNTVLYSGYGSTMLQGNAVERPGLTLDEPCIYDPFSPNFSFRVVDPDTRQPVPIGERGQVITSHISRWFFLPNNLERDFATRVVACEGDIGDAVADVAPVAQLDGERVVEGVY